MNDILENEERFVVTFNEITQIPRIKSLKGISKHKSRLLSSVSYELRTPLSPSMTMTELGVQEYDLNIYLTVK